MKPDGPYDDIIHLPHHVSQKHPRMSMHDRAAQFASFSALTGLEAAILETARVTDVKLELDESQQTRLSTRLALAQKHIREQPELAILYFRPDERKEGGAYVTTRGRAKKIDPVEHLVVMADGTRIPMDDIYTVEGELLDMLDPEQIG